MKVQGLFVASILLWGVQAQFEDEDLGFVEGPPEISEDVGATPKNSVAVVGAGLGGLTAAYNLQKMGYTVTIFEAEDRVGGKMNSIYLPDGVPARETIAALDEEQEARAFEICGDLSPTDLGAIIGTGDNMKALADELDIPYAPLTWNLDNIAVQLDGVTTSKLTRAQFLGAAALQAAPDEDPQQVIGAAFQAFFAMVEQFPEILANRLDGSDPELALPLAEFGEKYGFSVLVDGLRPIMVGYGYGYFEDVPAGIYMTQLYPIIASAASGAIIEVFGFPCGFQSIAEVMSQDMDVRLNATVTSVERGDGIVTVQAEGQPDLTFEHLVVSTTLDIASSFLDLNDQEAELFGKLKYNRVLTTVTNAATDGADQEIVFYAEQGYEVNQNHITAMTLTNTNTTAEVAYQLLDENTTLEEAFAILAEDMDTYWQGSVEEIIAHRDWFNYFPHVSAQDFADGFFDDMEALQGVQNTYFVGSFLSFESTPFVEQYARELILRKFDNLTDTR